MPENTKKELVLNETYKITITEEPISSVILTYAEKLKFKNLNSKSKLTRLEYLKSKRAIEKTLSKIVSQLWGGLQEPANENGYIGDFSLTPELKDQFNPSDLKEAAVLIPIVIEEDGSLSILFTKRPEYMRRHKGEWVFPGGKMDPADANKTIAALRETTEEVGINAAQVFVIGELPDYHVRTGFNVTPVVGIIRGKLDYRLNPDEVERVMKVPLGTFLNALKTENIVQMEFNGKTINFYSFNHEGEEISGATAGMLAYLQKTLTAHPGFKESVSDIITFEL